MKQDLIFLLYASHDGHTLKIIKRMVSVLTQLEQEVSVYNVAERAPPAFMLEGAAMAMVISPVRFGHHLPAIDLFIKKHKHLFDMNKLGLVSINLTARKPEKNDPDTNPYFRKWLKRHKIEPMLQAVFGGMLDYPSYRWWEKQVIRFIMKITGGPTDPSTVIDYTNWPQVEALAYRIAEMSEQKQEVA